MGEDIDLTFRKKQLYRTFESPLRSLGHDLTALLTSSRVLDVGCRRGDLVKELLEYNPNAYGVDINRTDMPATTPIRTLVANAMQLPFADGSFDIVISANLYGYIADAGYVYFTGKGITPEIYRVLRKGGLYLLFDLGELDYLPMGNLVKIYPHLDVEGYPAMILRK